VLHGERPPVQVRRQQSLRVARQVRGCRWDPVLALLSLSGSTSFLATNFGDHRSH
jgi:hypothetical protein